MREHFCEHCNVTIAEDLRYCPLCGKFVRSDEKATSTEGANSYPIYDLSYIYRAKWLKIVRASFWFIAGLIAFINLVFKPNFLWFPYALAGIFVLWKIVFLPFKEGENHIKRLPVSGIILALFLIFIDIYDHLLVGTPIGWATIYSAPAVGSLVVIVSLILSLCNLNYQSQLVRGIVYMVVISTLVFALNLFVFKESVIWPSFMFFVSSSASLFILVVSKRRRIVKEINKSFHI